MKAAVLILCLAVGYAVASTMGDVVYDYNNLDPYNDYANLDVRRDDYLEPASDSYSQPAADNYGPPQSPPPSNYGQPQSPPPSIGGGANVRGDCKTVKKIKYEEKFEQECHNEHR